MCLRKDAPCNVCTNNIQCISNSGKDSPLDLCITFNVLFISIIIASVPPQIIRHQVLEVGDS